MSTPAFQSASFVAAAPFSLPAQSVNQSSALGIPALWAGLNLIATTAANCAPKVFDGYRVVDGTFIDRPCLSMTPYEWYSQTVAELVLHGNSYQFIIWNEAGQIDSLIPMPVTETSVRLVNGYPVYECQGHQYTEAEVMHLRGLTVSGSPKGLGVVEVHRRGLGLVLDQLALQSNQARTGGAPSLLVTMPVNAASWTPEAAEKMQTEWLDGFSGGQRRPAFMPQGADVKEIGMTSADLEFLASRSFSVAEVAFMLQLDPMDLNATIGGESMTYANLETREVARMKRIAPWFQRIEQKFDQYLPDGLVARFISEKQLRTDTDARYKSYETALRAGFLTLDEVRELEGRPPLENP